MIEQPIELAQIVEDALVSSGHDLEITDTLVARDGNLTMTVEVYDSATDPDGMPAAYYEISIKRRSS